MEQQQPEGIKIEGIKIGRLNIDQAFTAPLREELKPRDLSLKPFIEYINQLNNLSPKDKEILIREYGIANALLRAYKQPELSRNLSLRDIKDLYQDGLDLAQILKLFLLQSAYHSGIDIKKPYISLALEKKEIEGLLEYVQRVFPQYGSLTSDEFSRILERMGFKDHPEGGSYISRLDQKGLQELFTQIAKTSSQ